MKCLFVNQHNIHDLLCTKNTLYSCMHEKFRGINLMFFCFVENVFRSLYSKLLVWKIVLQVWNVPHITFSGYATENLISLRTFLYAVVWNLWISDLCSTAIYMLQHIETDCGIEILHTKLTHHPNISKLAYSLRNLASGILVNFKNAWLALGL